MSDMAPLRPVTDAHAISGRGGLLGEQGRRTRWWELTLECGHKVQRPVRYQHGAKPSNGGRGWGVIPLSAAKPAPKRARCEQCAN